VGDSRSGEDVLDQERGDNPVLEGGRIMRPWASKDEVPESVWKGHRWSMSKHSDEDYLGWLNEYYHYVWINENKKKKEAKAREQVGPGSSTVPCANVECSTLVTREERLCEWCKDKIRKLGFIDQGHGWEIRCVESDT